MSYLVIFGSLLGYTAYLYALKNLPVSTVSLYAYVNPVIAVVLGSVVLAEPFTLRIVLASALVFGGIGIVRSAPRVPKTTATAAEAPCRTREPAAYATR